MDDSVSTDTSIEKTMSSDYSSRSNDISACSNEADKVKGNTFDKESSESSSFHGFSSQEYGAETSEEMSNVKQKMFDDFGLGNEISEEESEVSDVEGDKLKIATIESEFEPNLNILERVDNKTTNSEPSHETKEEDLLNESKEEDSLNESKEEDSLNESREEDSLNDSKEEDSLNDSKEEEVSIPHLKSIESVTPISQFSEVSNGQQYKNNSDEPMDTSDKHIVNNIAGDISGESSPEHLNLNKSITEELNSDNSKSSPSPKKVHFSDKLESYDEPPQLTVRPKLGPDLSPCILARETEPPIIESTPKKSTISPPLKLKIKFGKDSTGAITHGKIKKKSAMSFSSDEDQKPLFAGRGLINESLSDEELDLYEDEEEEYELPQDPDSYFHGFPEKHIPDWVFDNFKNVDLKTRFKIKPTVFVSISSKKGQQKAAQQPAVPKAATPSVSIKSPTKSPILKQNTSLANTPPPPAAATPTPILDLHSISSSSKKKGKSDKNLNYIKPLLDGWVREVVWRSPPGSKKPDADVYYYPPHTGEGKKQKFRSANELEGFLITSSSFYPMTFFTFKKEPVGGPEGCEIVRESANVSKVKSKLPETGKSPESPIKEPAGSLLGKRVSKPPDKLILDITETDGTPSRVSKRVSRPPDKLELESMPVAKAPRLEINEKRQSSPKLESWSTVSGSSKPASKDPDNKLGPKDPENKPGSKDSENKSGSKDSENKFGCKEPENKLGDKDPGNKAFLKDQGSKSGLKDSGKKLGVKKTENNLGSKGHGKLSIKGPENNTGIKDPENIVQSPKQVTTTKVNMPGGGLLKLKMFSKMTAGSKNQVEEEKSPEVVQTAQKANTHYVDKSHLGVSITPAAPKVTGGGMTITKVKKPPSSGTINLPGVPTIGPPPKSFDITQHRTKSSLPSPSPSISITPLNSNGQQLMNRPLLPSTDHLRPLLPSTDHLRPLLPSTDHLVAVPKILRPSRPTTLPCSIHCPGVTGIPSLSCMACHCLYHPKCVGLPTSLSSSANHEFYCNECTPGLAVEKPPPPPPMLHSPIIPTANSHHKPTQPPPLTQMIKHKEQDRMKENKENNISQNEMPRALKSVKAPPPPAPFSGQGMISIAGRKFLVIPHPSPMTTIESPPPSPPLPTSTTSVRGITPVDKTRRKSQNSLIINEKLDLLLKPADPNDKLPSFEVEQTPDGKYLLLPVEASKNKNVFTEPAPVGKKRKSSSTVDVNGVSPSKVLPSWGNNFTNNLSGGYHAMLQVFRYLPVKERLLAGTVCKLWRDISQHPSLWRTVSLKNTRVYDWSGFGRFLLKTKATHLDVRKMLFVKDRDQTWSEILNVAGGSGDFACLRKLELPKVGGSTLASLVSACPRLESILAPLASPPVDVNIFGKMTSLKELRLKSGAGGNSLRADNGMSELVKLAPTLTHLSLLTVDGLSGAHFDVLGTLVHLKLLEIGECTTAPDNLFKILSDLTKMERLRLEKGTVGENISKLANAPKLRQLELIDFRVLPGFKEGLKVTKNLQKLLIIPTYKDEVAKINSEIVEGVTAEMNQLNAFYLGVTNEWLEAMALAMGSNKVQKAGGEKECFPLEREGQVEHISLPALYRLICREMPHCKVKVLKMSAQATCKQFIANLDQS